MLGINTASPKDYSSLFEGARWFHIPLPEGRIAIAVRDGEIIAANHYHDSEPLAPDKVWLAEESLRYASS